MAVYKSRSPPDYALDRLKGLNFHMYYGTTDTVMAKRDVYRLVAKLKDQNSVQVTEISNFNHLDYIFASNVTEILYKPVFHAMGLIDADVGDNETDSKVIK